jgi:RHH-type proline utilization regulon transcriptional repressor/proline dehydrogenase/delta 1-pyrroline-5-carboxylate dehydrogenase
LQEDVADTMVAMIEGAAAELTLSDPADFAADIGPVIDAEAKAGLEAQVAVMRAADFATVRYAGTLPPALSSRGTFFPPHIVELDSPARLTTEIFGPVLHVVRWKAGELDRAIDAIAASGFALTLGIHSRVEATVAHVIRRLAGGNVYVNRSMIGAVVGVQPFGGSGLSGTGPKAGGPDYLRRFALEQVVSVNTAAVGGNAALIAMGDE